MRKLAVAQRESQRTSDRRESRGIVRLDALLERPMRHRAIHQTGVDEREADGLGQAPGECALARAGGTVDGHYESGLAHGHRMTRAERRSPMLRLRGSSALPDAGGAGPTTPRTRER